MARTDQPVLVPRDVQLDDRRLLAVVELYVPWAENRVVCAGHARVIARQDGVVADPLDEADDAWP